MAGKSGIRHVLASDMAQDALCFDPFEGDRDTDVVTFSDKIVIVRKQHRCTVCLGKVRRGEQARALTQRFDGGVETFRICVLCLRAAVLDDRDCDWQRMELRYAVGWRRAQRIRERHEARERSA